MSERQEFIEYLNTVDKRKYDKHSEIGLKEIIFQRDKTIADQQRVVDELKQIMIALSKQIDPPGMSDECEEVLESARKLLGDSDG